MQLLAQIRKAVYAVVLATSLGLASAAHAAPAATAPTEVTICQYGDLLIYLPLYIAQERHFFEQQGVAVRFINGGGDDKTFAALASGAAQFGVSDPTFTAIARQRGQRAVVVSTVVAGATYWGVTWNANIKPTRSAAGLKDLRIATYESPSTNYALMARTLQDNRKAVGSATIVQGSYGALLAMLRANRADVAMELEPAASTAVSQGAHIVYSYPEMYGPFMLTGLYVLEDYRDAHRATVQGVVNALELAMRYAHDNPNGAIDVARHKFPGVSDQVLKSAVLRMIKDATLPGHVSMDPKGWANAVAVRVALGDLKDPAAAARTLDTTFVTNALRIK